MKLWFAPGSGIPLYRQLGTQIMLGILAGDLKPGAKLPSTRALAQRFNVHPNTISAAYGHLERENWVVSRKGSGVYVREGNSEAMTPEQILEVHIAGFFQAVRELGLPPETVKSQVARWLAAPAPDQLLLVEDDPLVAQILTAELQALSSLPVRIIAPDACLADRRCLAGAVPLCRPSRREAAQAAIGPGVELLVLPINSALASLAPALQAAPGHLIAIASHWPEFLETTRTMLLAAGIQPDALVLVDARELARLPSLAMADAVVCDVYTASQLRSIRTPQLFVFPLLAASAHKLLSAFEPPTSPGATGTLPKLS